MLDNFDSTVAQSVIFQNCHRNFVYTMIQFGSLDILVETFFVSITDLFPQYLKFQKYSLLVAEEYGWRFDDFLYKYIVFLIGKTCVRPCI